MVELAANPGSTRRRKATTKSETSADLVTSSEALTDDCAALQAHIAEHLVVLRAEFQETVASYSVRVQGMLSQAGDLLLDDTGKLSATDRKHRERGLRRIVEALEALDLKPAKGRRRDLKAVERFATQLGDEVAEW
jgi:hypothetical protein